ncbi:uncharacterized protein LOC127741119 [Arachis duranensis]|uniref:Uncharacterized protein LOC127741119 n=1 Tax=Arachis duranensis TaxID=130453 RepID=A0A9C6WB90_ARADU|nr:uncharacterized protein LOC127741119 [Arachis duranensis]
MTEADLQRLRDQGAICGGGDAERQYELALPDADERVGYLNLDSPTVPDWKWVYESMFTRLSVRLPFSPFVQDLLSRCYVAPSQLHPNSWAAVWSFELREYFKVRPVQGHHPFWLTLEGEHRFPTYWNFGAGPSVLTKVTYDVLSPEDKDIASVLWHLFGERPLNPRDVMGDLEACRTYIVEMAGGLTSLSRLKAAMDQEEGSSASPANPASNPAVDSRAVSQEVVSSGVRVGARASPGPVSSPEVVVVTAVEASWKRKRPEEPSSETFREEGVVPTVMDRRFDASGFIDQHLMPGTEPFFYDCDVSFQAKSVYHALLRSAVIVRKAEPVMAQVDLLDKKLRHSQAEVAKLKELFEAAEVAREKAVKSSEEAGAEILRLSEVETSLLSQLSAERQRASDAGSQAAVILGELEVLKAKVAALKKEKAELLVDAKGAIVATEKTMRAQASVLAPGADVSVMGAFKTVRDGQIVDLA